MKVKLDFEICQHSGNYLVRPYSKQAKKLAKYFAKHYDNTIMQEHGTLIVGAEDKPRVMFELCDHNMTAQFTF